MNFNKSHPLTQMSQNSSSNLLSSLKNPKKKEKSILDSDISLWQNIPDVIQRAVASLLENQNNLTDKLKAMEKKQIKEKTLIEEARITREERLTEIVSQLGEEVQNLKHGLKSQNLENEEGINFKLRKFVLGSEMEMRVKDLQDRIEKNSKMLKLRVDREEFRKSVDSLENGQNETTRKLQEKVDELELMAQKDDLERLISSQMQKVGKLISDNSIKILRNSKACLLYTSPSPRDLSTSRMPSSA